VASIKESGFFISEMQIVRYIAFGGTMKHGVLQASILVLCFFSHMSLWVIYIQLSVCSQNLYLLLMVLVLCFIPIVASFKTTLMILFCQF